MPDSTDELKEHFRNPPAGYGEIAFYWWLGDPLTRERLTWQLDQLADMHISGLQINYAHSDSGGHSYGLTYASDPPLFSEAWWELFGWFMGEAKKRSMSVSLSDYTIGPPGQGWYADEILQAHPDARGTVLHPQSIDVAEGQLDWAIEHEPLAVAAFALDGEAIRAETRIDLFDRVRNGRLSWTAPAGRWRVTAVCARVVDVSIDPLHPRVGAEVCQRFFQRFEDRFPGEAGRGLNFFFSDELTFNVKGHLWTADFAAQFKRRKGYDLIPELPALYWKVGSRWPKVRLDYWDVLVSLEEERYFKPLFDWHESRGMTYGCDHGGRGRDVAEFGDYFRTQRWVQGPGADQPHLGKDLIKAKVAASIAHLYRRRTWLEGFYGSGWGTSTAQVIDATFANFAMGFNILTLHGLYYSTHGSFWEWAPPCNHFHMPYWHQTRPFMACSERLSYLLSQGAHRCDVAVLYPVETAHADPSLKNAGSVAFDIARSLYADGIDFDFIDWQSLAGSRCERGELRAADARYRVLILPDLRVVRQSTLEAALAFHRAGGIVIAVGALPEASDRSGANVPWVDANVREIFGKTSGSTTTPTTTSTHRASTGGVGVHLPDAGEAARFVANAFPRDLAFHHDLSTAGQPYFQHRTAGSREIYFIYNVPAGTRCSIRAVGRAELWNPWTGETRALPVTAQTDSQTTLHLPLGPTQPNIIVFSPGQPVMASTSSPTPSTEITLDGDWHFEVVPVLDNRFGDYEWPPTATLIGPEVRQIRCKVEASPDEDFSGAAFDDSHWPKVTASFGPRLWRVGPLPDDIDITALEVQLGAMTELPADQMLRVGSHVYKWTPYEFSWRWGLEGDPGPQGYHGLKSRVTDDFLTFGQRGESKHSSIYLREPNGHRYFFWTTITSAKETEAEVVVGGTPPQSIRLGGTLIQAGRCTVGPGTTPLLVRYDDAGRGHVVLGAAGLAAIEPLPIGALRMRWHEQPSVLEFDAMPQWKNPASWYRFAAPPGLRSFRCSLIGSAELWVDGQKHALRELGARAGGVCDYEVVITSASVRPVSVAIRIAHERGVYGGAAMPEPIRLVCGPGTWTLGDWSLNDALLAYSGAARYARSFDLLPQQSRGRVELDLGQVISSAEVRLNGHDVGTLLAPPWRLDVSTHVREGRNDVEVLVFSTLANHYTTIPSRYRGDPTAGLIGPVTVRCT